MSTELDRLDNRRLNCFSILKQYLDSYQACVIAAVQLDFEKQHFFPIIPKMLYDARLTTIEGMFEIVRTRHCFDNGIYLSKKSKACFEIQFQLNNVEKHTIWPADYSIGIFFHADLLPIIEIDMIFDNNNDENSIKKSNGWRYFVEKNMKKKSAKVTVFLMEMVTETQ